MGGMKWKNPGTNLHGFPDFFAAVHGAGWEGEMKS